MHLSMQQERLLRLQREIGFVDDGAQEGVLDARASMKLALRYENTMGLSRCAVV